ELVLVGDRVPLERVVENDLVARSLVADDLSDVDHPPHALVLQLDPELHHEAVQSGAEQALRDVHRLRGEPVYRGLDRVRVDRSQAAMTRVVQGYRRVASEEGLCAWNRDVVDEALERLPFHLEDAGGDQGALDESR